MYVVQELDGIFFQDVVQIYLLSLNFYEPIFHRFFDGWHLSYWSF
jgi:hypothetical protein